MADFNVKTDKMRSAKNELDSCKTSLSSIEAEVRSIRWNLGFKISSSADFGRRLGGLADEINGEKRNVSDLSSALNRSISQYERTENLVTGNAKNTPKIKNAIEAAFAYIEDKTGWAKKAFEHYDDLIGYFNDLRDAYKDANLAALVLGGWGLYDYLKDLPSTLKDEFDQGVMDLTTVSASGKAEYEYMGARVDGKYGSAGVSVGAAEAYYDASAGLFTKDEDGNLVFNPNVGVEAGASFTAFSADASGKIGNDYANIHGDASVTAGEVSANVKAKAALLDENGNFDPTAHVKASAEAIAVEAKAEAGATVLGAEANVHASAFVGAGAHADIGIEGGVVTFDLGIGLGVGVSAGFEVDISGLQKGVNNALMDGAKTALKWLAG